MFAMRSGSTALDNAIMEYRGSVRKANRVLISGTSRILRLPCLFATSLVHPLYPVADGGAGAPLKVGNAADIGRQNPLGRLLVQRRELPAPQLLGQLRLQDRVGARRAAAQVGVTY